MTFPNRSPAIRFGDRFIPGKIQQRPARLFWPSGTGGARKRLLRPTLPDK
jgi:hypothetical protein